MTAAPRLPAIDWDGRIVLDLHPPRRTLGHHLATTFIFGSFGVYALMAAVIIREALT